jgi:hypothetical protein
MGRASKPAEGSSWGDLRPRRACPFEEEDEQIVLLRPRYGRGRLGRWVERRLGSRPLRLRLDEVGSFVWGRCDGDRKVAAISEDLRLEFGERIEPAEERLVLFLTGLLRNGCISVATEEPAQGD